jgi:hypothetical protein
MTVEIPDGWIPVCSYDKRTDKSNGGARGEYALLLKAVNNHAIDSMSLGRPKKWYVRKDQAERFLSEHASGRPRGDSTPEVVQMLTEIHAMLRSLVENLK